MNAAADKLAELIHGMNPVTVKTVRVDTGLMVPSLVKQRFEAAKQVEINEYGMGALQADGSWLWIDGPQPGGRRA